MTKKAQLAITILAGFLFAVANGLAALGGFYFLIPFGLIGAAICGVHGGNILIDADRYGW